jgi:putative NIF3 family GTP cyclohydrolase 1 type 2
VSRQDETARPDGVTRRAFIALGSAGLVAPAWFRQGAAAPTVRDVIARVDGSLGSAAPSLPAATTVDGLKAGRAEARVTGIVTTAMATSDVIRRAAAAGRNLVISYEPTFYARADLPSPDRRETDAVCAAKRALLDARGVIVWRLHDRWLARRPDPMVQGFADTLFTGADARDAAMPHRITLHAPTTLSDLAARMRGALDARALRVIGAPDLPVRRVAICPGPTPLAFALANVGAVDALVVGEPREWEAVEHMQDTIAAGLPKAMVLVGRVLSEDPGMQVMARWLAPLVPEVPVEWMSAGDPYWRPAAGA